MSLTAAILHQRGSMNRPLTGQGSRSRLCPAPPPVTRRVRVPSKARFSSLTGMEDDLPGGTVDNNLLAIHRLDEHACRSHHTGSPAYWPEVPYGKWLRRPP